MMTNIFSSFTLTDPETVDCRSAEEVEIQVTDLSGGDTITISRSLDNVTFIDQMLAGPIAADTIYLDSPGAYLKFTKTGVASTPTVTVRKKVQPRPAQPGIVVSP